MGNLRYGKEKINYIPSNINMDGGDINQVSNSYRRHRRTKENSQFSGLGLLVLKLCSLFTRKTGDN